MAPPADAAASGVQVTDKAGKAVTEAADGSDLYFSVPEDATDGSASLTVQATTSVPVGRVFAGLTKSQTMILMRLQRVDRLRDGDRHLGREGCRPGGHRAEELRQGRRRHHREQHR